MPDAASLVTIISLPDVDSEVMPCTADQSTRAARARPEGALLYATDDRPASFGEFMDHFARRIGNPLPLHLPGISRPLAHAVIAEEHMQMVQLGVHGVAAPRPDGFTPAYADFRSGLDEIVAGWKG